MPHIITLNNINYIPYFWCKLLPITIAMKKLMDLHGYVKSLLLKVRTYKIVKHDFNKILNADTGFLFSIEGTHVKNI